MPNVDDFLNSWENYGALTAASVPAQGSVLTPEMIQLAATRLKQQDKPSVPRSDFSLEYRQRFDEYMQRRQEEERRALAEKQAAMDRATGRIREPSEQPDYSEWVNWPDWGTIGGPPYTEIQVPTIPGTNGAKVLETACGCGLLRMTMQTDGNLALYLECRQHGAGSRIILRVGSPPVRADETQPPARTSGPEKTTFTRRLRLSQESGLEAD